MDQASHKVIGMGPDTDSAMETSWETVRIQLSHLNTRIL